MYPHVVDSSANSQRVVSLNVGGAIFTTSLQTLKNDPESTLAGELLLVECRWCLSGSIPLLHVCKVNQQSQRHLKFHLTSQVVAVTLSHPPTLLLW